jgi:hypothetical protein
MLTSILLLVFPTNLAKEGAAPVACHYFKKGCFSVCTASGLSHVPNIAEMKRFCFQEYYRICPIFEDFRMKRSQPCQSEKSEFAYNRR